MLVEPTGRRLLMPEDHAHDGEQTDERNDVRSAWRSSLVKRMKMEYQKIFFTLIESLMDESAPRSSHGSSSMILDNKKVDKLIQVIKNGCFSHLLLLFSCHIVYYDESLIAVLLTKFPFLPFLAQLSF